MRTTQVGRWTVAMMTFGAAGCAVGGGDGDVDEVAAIAQSALTTTYQAENAADIDEGVVETLHGGFTGTGYVNINNFSNTFFLHIVAAPVAGPATLAVRYANGTTTNRPIRITVNGATAGTVPGAPTGAWSTWATATVSINLLAGNNDVVHSSVTSDGMPNIDRFDIFQSFTRTFQAEAAADIDEGVVEAIHGGGNAARSICQRNERQPPHRHLGERLQRLRARSATGSWSTWATATVPINLAAGDNVVAHSSVAAEGMPNIDRFDITW